MISKTINQVISINNKSKPILCLHNVRVAYQSLVALIDIDLDIYQGELVGICGPNGSGKTTLFKTILGITKPYHGTINIYGQNIIQKEISTNVKHKIGYVPQVHDIDKNFPALVKDVVMMGRYSQIGFVKRPSKDDWNIVHDALKSVNMESFINRPIGHLSGGQQQKVMIARALAQEPEIILFDEPTSALDFKMTDDLLNLIKKLHKEKKLTILMINHNINLLKKYSSRIICLNHKKAFDGSPDSLELSKAIKQVFLY